jgi:nucleotide-binding universal stress UspA family protein
MFSSILWPVDGTPLSFTPMQTIINLAKLSNATVVVLSIAEPRLFRASDSDAIAAGNQVEDDHLTSARREVDKVRAAVVQAGVVCYDLVALSALPSAEIVRTAEQRGCDLIVMATRGKMGVIDTLFNTSCTQAVIETSNVPVLVLP